LFQNVIFLPNETTLNLLRVMLLIAVISNLMD